MDDGSNCHPSPVKENRLVAVPVVAGSSGLGLPYAPEDWPCPGDRWRWKVGSRKSSSGHWVDRYLYAPPTCPKSGGRRHGNGFPSRVSVEEYIRKEFPDADVNAFFSSFIWRVPCADFTPQKENDNYACSYSRSFDTNERTKCELAIGPGDCKAGNVMCSLQGKVKTNTSSAKDCDICCSEVGFCHDCCCILCCKTVDWAYEGYGFIRCEASVDEQYICGHVAHVECALRSYMAGTVGGSIGLDVEYYCRRCDNKTDLMPHVTKLLKVCESVDSKEDMEKILNLGFCILRGSEQERAKNLQNHIRFAIAKLKRGVPLDEIWKVEDSITILPAGDMHHNGNEIAVLGAMDTRTEETRDVCRHKVELLKKIEAADCRAQSYITSDYNSVSVKLEGEIDQVLRQLKRSQEMEYRIAEQKLYVQKDYLLSLYRQLDYERAELENPAPSPVAGDCDALLTNVLHRVDQIKHEEEKLREMMKIASGFGQTPKSVIGDHYGLVIND
ncbi:protein OBERON 2-like [Musa acuminata AAA Group]|uniref:protein OBERON 2 n=1 Tax=Musa acuminata AAA Group TaxID=214697 RepID=UPI0031CED5EF